MKIQIANKSEGQMQLNPRDRLYPAIILAPGASHTFASEADAMPYVESMTALKELGTLSVSKGEAAPAMAEAPTAPPADEAPKDPEAPAAPPAPAAKPSNKKPASNKPQA